MAFLVGQIFDLKPLFISEKGNGDLMVHSIADSVNQSYPEMCLIFPLFYPKREFRQID